ncbi:MAG: MaoC family dehydratase N-terminal domain-containing protein [Chloroflexi bacterium]|nr:MaoC family dehydratase N-terminal domain-containing protein [Chloroflexota bacterium]
MPLPKEITDLIGKTIFSTTFEVEKGAIARFAEAVDDPNPLYWDEEYARKSRQGSIIAPPGFFGWPVKRSAAPEDRFGLLPALARAGYSRILDGGIEWEFFSPVRAGDRLKVETTLRNAVERSGKTGRVIFVFRETKYTREGGEMVATERQTTIHPAG